jgi:hypothetical protein
MPRPAIMKEEKGVGKQKQSHVEVIDREISAFQNPR